MENMDGLWVVEFASSLGLFGRGVMVLNGERVLGGDVGYYYSGQCTLEENRIKAQVDVIRFDPNAISVFGDIENFKLTFDGTINGCDFTAHAKSDSFPNMEMGIKASKKEDL
jgi:hypothetical protein